jgi:hypothetical protein
MIKDASYNPEGTSFGKSPKKTFLLTNNPVMTKSPMKGDKKSREKKRKVIEESVRRLASPPKKDRTNEGHYDDQDLIFSIKMTKDEYLQYQKTRDFYKTKKK